MKSFAISLKKQFVVAFLSGKKTVELRTRLPELAIGDELVVVETKTNGSVPMVLEVLGISYNERVTGWNLYHQEMFLSLREYIKYVDGRMGMWFVRCKLKETYNPARHISEWGLKRAPQWFAEICYNDTNRRKKR